MSKTIVVKFAGKSTRRAKSASARRERAAVKKFGGRAVPLSKLTSTTAYSSVDARYDLERGRLVVVTKRRS